MTYITGSPSSTANSTASRVSLSMRSSVQPSAYWRIGEEPMKQAASMAMPVRCEISTIGWMSATTVRAAQLGAIVSFCVDDLAGQPLDVAHHVRPGAGQADVGGLDAELRDHVQDA